MSPTSVLLAVYATGLGLIVGSYLNVVIHRLPREESTLFPRSRCPSCGAAIAAYDNVPVVSYLWLRGRCRSCKTRISARYPAIEALTGALFLACFLRFGPAIEAVAAALFCALMVALGAIDAEHYILPDRITLPGIVVGLAFSPWLSWSGLGAAVLGATIGAAILSALWWGWYLWRKEEGLGLGDVKMLAMVGAFLGWKGALVTLFAGALAGSLVGVVLMSRGQAGMKTKLPFGTFLAAGGVLALFAGPAIMRSYLATF